MEISVKGLTGGKLRSGMVKSLRTFFHNAVTLAPQNALPYEMLAHGVAYEASKTYRVIKSEFECQRASAIVEGHRQGLRGF